MNEQAPGEAVHCPSCSCEHVRVLRPQPQRGNRVWLQCLRCHLSWRIEERRTRNEPVPFERRRPVES